MEHACRVLVDQACEFRRFADVARHDVDAWVDDAFQWHHIEGGDASDFFRLAAATGQGLAREQRRDDALAEKAGGARHQNMHVVSVRTTQVLDCVLIFKVFVMILHVALAEPSATWLEADARASVAPACKKGSRILL